MCDLCRGSQGENFTLMFEEISWMSDLETSELFLIKRFEAFIFFCLTGPDHEAG